MYTSKRKLKERTEKKGAEDAQCARLELESSYVRREVGEPEREVHVMHFTSSQRRYSNSLLVPHYVIETDLFR
jgi:hypothetical protein